MASRGVQGVRRLRVRSPSPAPSHRGRDGSRRPPAKREMGDRDSPVRPSRLVLMASATLEVNRARYQADKEGYKRRARMLASTDEAKDVPCLDCGGRFLPCAMDFDHRPGEEKVMSVAQLVTRGNEAKLRAEIAKCDVVCANCHRVRTSLRQRS